MKANLTRAIKNYKNVSIYECVNEAIVNSLQADASEIEIQIQSIISKELYNNKEIISKIIIQDNGNGFNEDNRKSFLELHSDYKEIDGCKGIGRLSYLKGFQNVKISSRQNNELVEFEFTKELQEEQLQPRIIDSNEKQTILTLENPIKEETYNLDKIYEEIFNHIYPFIFLKDSECVININDRKITKEDVKNIENAKFNVKKTINNEDQSIEFNLWYRFQEDNKTILDDFICINNRPMQHFYNKPLSLKLNSKEKYHITFLLESDWIDKLETDQYHRLPSNEDDEFEENHEQAEMNIYVNDDLYKNKDLIKQIWKDVKQELIKKLNEIMITKFPQMQTENKKIINNLKAKYPHYADFIENDNISFVNEKQLLKNAREQALKEEDKLENDNVSMNDIQKCVSNDLIRYILHRQEIINKLQEMNKNNESLEKNIHNLLLQKGLERDNFSQIDLDKNNLWLLDDKFMSYNYIASDRQIANLLKLINTNSGNNQDRPDIAIYTNTNDNKKVVFIELKKFNANGYDNSKGLDELTVYSNYIVESGVNEIYCYLIINLDDKTRTILKGRGYIKIFSQESGEIWQNKISEINSYVQIISPNAIIADANARNKTFLDIIKKSKIPNE